MDQNSNTILENLSIEGTKKTPAIEMDVNGSIKISGRSLPENSREFFAQPNQWIDLYIQNPAEKTVVDFRLSYVNSSSTVIIYRMVQYLDEQIKDNSHLILNWYHENDDPDMEELGSYIKDACKATFNIIGVDELN